MQSAASVTAQTKHLVDFFKDVLLPTLALLATGVAKMMLDRFQNHSRARRSEDLTRRISELEDAISKLPKREPSEEMRITPEKVLTDELKQNIAELKYLQERVHYSFHQFCNDVSFRTRRILLLYRPRGFAGFLLHSLFYGYLAVVLVIVAFTGSVISEPDDASAPTVAADGNPGAGNAAANAAQPAGGVEPVAGGRLGKVAGLVGEILALMLMFSVLSIPAWILRHFALKRLDKDGKPAPASEQVTQQAMAGSSSL